MFPLLSWIGPLPHCFWLFLSRFITYNAIIWSYYIRTVCLHIFTFRFLPKSVRFWLFVFVRRGSQFTYTLIRPSQIPPFFWSKLLYVLCLSWEILSFVCVHNFSIRGSSQISTWTPYRVIQSRNQILSSSYLHSMLARFVLCNAACGAYEPPGIYEFIALITTLFLCLF